MRVARAISEAEIEALEAQAPKIKGRREYRRPLFKPRAGCRVFYCEQKRLVPVKTGNKSPEEIAKVLGIHARTVQKHQQSYFQKGMKAFEVGIPGPKGPRLLKQAEEAALFASLQEEAATGQLLNATKIKARFQEKAGKTCATSTIYVMIHRNKWSKKQPEPALNLIQGPRHPKGDEEAKSLFIA